MNVKETITKFHPNWKNIVIFRTDKKEANNILKKYNTILKQEKRNVIFHNNISASQEIFYQGCVRFDMTVSNDRNGNKRLPSNHTQQIIIGHLNISSIKNKLDRMKPMLLDDIDILMVTETKLDDFFPASHFNVEGFSTPFRLDGNKNGRGIILYIRSYTIASKLTSFAFPNGIEAFFIEVSLKGNKWLVCCSYNLNRTFVSNQLDDIAKGINSYSKKCEKNLLMEDFNAGFTEANMVAFCN